MSEQSRYDKLPFLSMFLSNRQGVLPAFCLLAIITAGCAWFQNGQPVPVTPANVASPDSRVPFETKEPETYQADFVTIGAGSESRSHFARKAGRWRLDIFREGAGARSIVSSPTMVYIDHVRKRYSVSPAGGPDARPGFINDLTTSLLNERSLAKIEKFGSEGTIELYKVTPDDGTGTSTIFFDTSIGMVTKQEFDGGLAFEMRNFTLDVDDSVFSVPDGYRKVEWAAFIRE